MQFFDDSSSFRCFACAVLVGLALGTGCAEQTAKPTVFYCEGAGWYSSASSVESGLRRAGFKGRFVNYSWSAFLGPSTDHLITARSGAVAKGLAKRIEKARRNGPDMPIYAMGLSAGTAVVLNALERLPDGIRVDHVVLFSSSASSTRNLVPIMERVTGRLYATTSPHDGILRAIVTNADGGGGPPAGKTGFVMPAQRDHRVALAYSRVINLPWRASYLQYGWDGGHTDATEASFVEHVIAPRILRSQAHPLDRPMFNVVNGQHRAPKHRPTGRDQITVGIH